jgi:hypothetical protein
MKLYSGLSNRFILPLPAFVLHPLTALFLGAVHIYLATGHLSKLFGGPIHWTDIWKGFGALAGAYVFAALASRGLAQHRKSETAGNTIVSETPKFMTNPANSDLS